MVNDHPATAFTETHRDLLDLYCQHVTQAQVLADEIQAFDRAWLADDDGLKRYDRLLGMREREVRSASSLATRSEDRGPSKLQHGPLEKALGVDR
jgi:hypothetical protein